LCLTNEINSCRRCASSCNSFLWEWHVNSIKYASGYKYQLLNTYTISIPIHGVSAHTDYISLTPTGELTIKKSYAWDGPSGPTFDTRNFMRGSLVHDCLYQCIRLGLIPKHLKKAADTILQSICLEDGMSRIRAWWIRKGLEIAGKSSTLPSRIRKILYAP